MGRSPTAVAKVRLEEYLEVSVAGDIPRHDRDCGREERRRIDTSDEEESMAVDAEDEDALDIKEDGRLSGHLACELVRWDNLDMERPKRQFCRDTLVLTSILADCDFLEEIEGGGRRTRECRVTSTRRLAVEIVKT